MDKQEFLKIVSTNIKKYRAQNGLTQEKFAEKPESVCHSAPPSKPKEKRLVPLRCGIWRTD